MASARLLEVNISAQNIICERCGSYSYKFIRKYYQLLSDVIMTTSLDTYLKNFQKLFQHYLYYKSYLILLLKKMFKRSYRANTEVLIFSRLNHCFEVVDTAKWIEKKKIIKAIRIKNFLWQGGFLIQDNKKSSSSIVRIGFFLFSVSILRNWGGGAWSSSVSENLLSYEVKNIK